MKGLVACVSQLQRKSPLGKSAHQAEWQPQKRSISLVLIGSTILAVGATALSSYQIVRGLILNSLETNAIMQVQKAGDEIDGWLTSLRSQVEVLANTPAVRSLDWSVAEPYLQLEQDRLSDFYMLLVAKPDGSNYTTIKGLSPNIKDRIYFRRAVAGEANVDDPIIGRITGTWNAHITAPIWSVPRCQGGQTSKRAAIRVRSLAFFHLSNIPCQQARPIGVFSGSVAVKHVSEIVEKISGGEGSYAFALDSQGHPIAHPNKRLVEKSNSFLTFADPTLARISQAMVNHQRGIQLVQMEGKWVYVAYLPLRQANWSLALVIPRANLERQLVPLNLLASVLGVLLVMATLIALRQIQSFEQTRTYAKQLKSTLTELQNTQAQLIQTEKMSSLGQLVAGVAHEINNPVNFIYGNIAHASQYIQDLLYLVRLYQQRCPHSSDVIQAEVDAIDLEFLVEDLPKTLASMKIGAERIREIVLSLRNFSRLDEAEMKLADLHQGIESTLLILQNRLKAKPDYPGIEVIKEFGNLPKIECYPGQLNQVFMNVFSNAIDALELVVNRQLSAVSSIKQRTTDHGPQTIPTIQIRTEVINDRVFIRIKDNGPGMTAEVGARIFDPFFTTKAVGQGTGLGLAVSYQIVVEKHGGALKCLSELGQGAEFWIELPTRQTLAK